MDTSGEWSILAAFLALAGGYLSGSIPFGLILTRLAGLGDIRSIGSGNIGATNVLRTGNKGLAAATLLLDALKGLVPVVIAKSFGLDAALATGLGAFVGHLFHRHLRGHIARLFMGGVAAVRHHLASDGLSDTLFFAGRPCCRDCHNLDDISTWSVRARGAISRAVRAGLLCPPHQHRTVARGHRKPHRANGVMTGATRVAGAADRYRA